eukprot:gene5142-5650_t
MEIVAVVEAHQEEMQGVQNNTPQPPHATLTPELERINELYLLSICQYFIDDLVVFKIRIIPGTQEAVERTDRLIRLNLQAQFCEKAIKS